MKIGDLYVNKDTKSIIEIKGFDGNNVWIKHQIDTKGSGYLAELPWFNKTFEPYTPPRSTKTWWIPIVSLKINGTITPWWDGATCQPEKPNHKVVYNFDIVRHVFVDWVEFKYTEKEKTND